LQDIENFGIFKGLNGMCYFDVPSIFFACDKVLTVVYFCVIVGACGRP